MPINILTAVSVCEFVRVRNTKENDPQNSFIDTNTKEFYFDDSNIGINYFLYELSTLIDKL